MRPCSVVVLRNLVADHLTRHFYWNGGYFGTIYSIKAALPKPKTSNQELANNFVSGAIGGFAGTVLNTP